MAVDYSFKVRFGDTDAVAIVFFPNFYRWMDEATHEFFTELGHPTSELLSIEKISTPLLDSKCEFKTPLFFEDEVIVKTEVAEIHNKVFKLSHTFYRGETLVAEGYTLRAWTSFKGQPKAFEIPDYIRKKLIAHQKE
ncbi:4-hydroxybenzoyl-CoA thioesterase [Lysinibacillus contaminans]|uniref:4-hydroxybenzoyl-CoA thioesterase n=1 Tax=Lysinibacillus contaminans TaxID=1293441 RepID=A0ABR5K1S8_9BACI|nr:thioesterase family protein [Lysinibacillus contaminans]KOS68824.1 4-hydroxybenzoyl-CoA thioesterase [Lysinibacillus contaminans]